MQTGLRSGPSPPTHSALGATKSSRADDRTRFLDVSELESASTEASFSVLYRDISRQARLDREVASPQNTSNHHSLRSICMGLHFLKIAVVYLFIGTLLGLTMGITQKFVLVPVHAHLL